jgi:hypothetical protein
VSETQAMTEEQYEFDIAVSFAGEDRDYVSEVVAGVKGDVKVFYDEDYAVESWGEDGVEYFSGVYLSRARYAVMFVSQHYAARCGPTWNERRPLPGPRLSEVRIFCRSVWTTPSFPVSCRR